MLPPQRSTSLRRVHAHDGRDDRRRARQGNLYRASSLSTISRHRCRKNHHSASAHGLARRHSSPPGATAHPASHPRRGPTQSHPHPLQPRTSGLRHRVKAPQTIQVFNLSSFLKRPLDCLHPMQSGPWTAEPYRVWRHALMRHRSSFLFTALVLIASVSAHATVFANIHGVVHDPQHRPVAGAHVGLKAADSSFTLIATTDRDGEFELQQVPIGVYSLQVSATGFATTDETLVVASGTNPVVHIPLAISAAAQTVVVHGGQSSVSASDSVTPTTLITREDIDQTPGADRTIGMEMITDYVPGAYMTHDMLHMRGGHQTSWLIDGIAIPNTKIASNVGPQIDPKDIDSLETQRGSYASDVGDRTYGVFNVLPRNGFERDRDAELLLSGSNLGTGEAQLSLGDHNASTAWYASLAGARSDYGLATPVAQILHDATNSQSGFVSIIRNQTPKDQLRLDTQYRQDFFQVPYDPNPNDWEQASQYYESYGLRDGQTERDSFVIANWVHTLSPKALFSVAPFYHFNLADYDSPANDFPVATTWHQSSNYAGGQADAHLDAGPNAFSAGIYGFYQAESDLFGVLINNGSYTSQPNTGANANAGLFEFYLSDHLRLGRYFT